MGDDGHWRPPICSAVWNVGTPSPRPYWPDTTEVALLDVQSIVLRGHPLHAANAGVTLLNHMVQYMTTRLILRSPRSRTPRGVAFWSSSDEPTLRSRTLPR